MLIRNLVACLAFAAATSVHAQTKIPDASSSWSPRDVPPNAVEASGVSGATGAMGVNGFDGVSEAPSAPSTLSLDEALGLAAQNNPVLRGARASVAASEGAFMQAGARPNPSVSFLQEGFGGTDRTSTALVNQTLELGGKRRARLDVASYGRELAQASLDGRAAALRADVIAAFYTVLAAGRQLQVAEESSRVAQRFAEAADKRVRAGKVSPVEATKARVAANGARIESDNARVRVGIATETLANLMGTPLARNPQTSSDLDALPTLEPLSELLPRLADAPLAQTARAEMLRANAAIALERAKRMPDITLSAGMKRITTGGARDNQAVLGVSIPLPLFDTNKGALLEAVHNADKASADFDSETARLQLALTQAHANYERSTQEAQRLRADVLPAAREALDAMSRGYELGKFGLLDVLDAQRTLFQTQSQYVQALGDAHLAYAEIGRLIGTPLRAAGDATSSQP